MDFADRMRNLANRVPDERVDIGSLNDLYKYSDKLIAAIKAHE